MRMKYKCKITLGLDCYNESQSDTGIRVLTYKLFDLFYIEIHRTQRREAHWLTLRNLQQPSL